MAELQLSGLLQTGISDISVLASLENLRRVTLNNNNISSIAGAFNSFSAGTINLGGNPVDCAELDAYLTDKPDAVNLNFDSATCVE